MWHTPAMHLNFHLLVKLIFLDSMKRKQNSIDWPYIGPVIVDGDDKLGVDTEAIMCTKRIEAYAWIMNQALSMTPTRKRESIKMIIGDGLLTMFLLNKLNISSSCNFSYDVFLLLGVGGD